MAESLTEHELTCVHCDTEQTIELEPEMTDGVVSCVACGDDFEFDVGATCELCDTVTAGRGDLQVNTRTYEDVPLCRTCGGE